MLGGLAFLSPWLLAAIAGIPALWWLLRLMPPQPKKVIFPGFFFLKDIAASVTTPDKTPWWILLIRSLVVLFFILAMAKPVLHPSDPLPGAGSGHLLVVLDNGWASAAGWEKRVEKIKKMLARVAREGRSVLLIPTAPSAEDGRVHLLGPLKAAQAKGAVEGLSPQAWPSDHAETMILLEKVLGDYTVTHSVFVSDGLAMESAPQMLAMLQERGGGLTVVHDPAVSNPAVLKMETVSRDKLDLSFERLHAAATPETAHLLAYGADGGVLDDFKVTLPAGERKTSFSWSLRAEVRRDVARIGLRAPVMASTVLQTGAGWRQNPVGLLADEKQRENKSFLNEVYYLRRALEVTDQALIGDMEALSAAALPVIVLADTVTLSAEERVRLENWVKEGGFLVRFAGPNLAAAATEDALLPVKLRHGQRALQGAMTWEKPLRLGTIEEASPLFGLPLPEDVTVERQVLADPAPDVFEKTWLQLEDGTPLITAAPLGEGHVALVHTTAGPDWSDLCHSGLYVEMLQRMIALGRHAIADYRAAADLEPLLLLDAFGHSVTPDARPMARAIGREEDFTPSPATPPGIYGDAVSFQSFNLGSALPFLRAFETVPPRAFTETFDEQGNDDLTPFFLALALFFLIVDTIVSLGVRGVLRFSTAAALLLFLILPSGAGAGDEKIDMVSGVYLGYVETGDQDIDTVSHNGLMGLADVISLRTTVKIKGVHAVDPARMTLSFYPFLYWPMTEGQMPLSARAENSIQKYLKQGGMILFDTRDQQFGGAAGGMGLGTRKLRALTQNIQIPELEFVPSDHILTKSFYLLEEFPGRYVGGETWVERQPSAQHDGVTSVVIGANDWAAAWTQNAGDRARFTVEPGGEAQREIAYRFGVNLLMVALTGNYKADQVHIPFILERIGR